MTSKNQLSNSRTVNGDRISRLIRGTRLQARNPGTLRTSELLQPLYQTKATWRVQDAEGVEWFQSSRDQHLAFRSVSAFGI